MKNFLKSLIILVLLGMFSQSCTEKQNLQNNEFEFETVLKDNKSLLNEVSIIIRQYDEESHQLRINLIKNQNCHEIKMDFIKLNNEQKAMVWKDRIISDLKNKHFNKEEYYYLTKLFYLINSKAYIADSEENKNVRNAILSLWKKSIKENIKTTNLVSTLLSLTDHLIVVHSDKKNYRDCDCSWGGTCNCQWDPCKMTPGGCGILGYWNCIKACNNPV